MASSNQIPIHNHNYGEFNLFIKCKKNILLLFDNNKMSVLSKNLTCISRVTTVHSYTELCGQCLRSESNR